MPFKIMDQRRLSPSSYFEEIGFPTERQVGFWKPDPMHDHHGVGLNGMSQTSGSKSVASSALEKLIDIDAQSVECLELPQPCFAKDQKAQRSSEQHVTGAERAASLSMSSWRAMGHNPGSRSDLYVQPSSYIVKGNKIDMKGVQYEKGLFSSSLSDIFSKKLRLSSNDLFGQSADAITSHYEEEELFETLEEIEAQTIGNLLPDDDDLFSGVIDELECIAQPNAGDDIEDFDLFSSGGGMELEVEGDDSLSSCGAQRNSDFAGGISNGSVAGEHPYGEHPSRTLFVRNINSNVEDSELKTLFEQYGDIRTLYTACKHRGFVMISYYDIRGARNAMRTLQNKPLRRRKMDIHFSIPKDNPSEKDINQGTLVVFNLDSSVSNDDLRQIFGVYGEIKEIRETPHKRHHKFIEFYDVRAAEAALRALNRSDIAGKRIKLEPSRPGGARRCVMQQFSPDLEQEESSACLQSGSPPTNSPSGCHGLISHGATSSCMENGAIKGLHSTIRAPMRPFMENAFHGISSGVPSSLPTSMRVASAGNQSGLGEPGHSLGQMKFGFQLMPTFHPHSLPEYHDGLANGVPYNSPDTMAAMIANINPRPSEGIDNRHIHRLGSNGQSVEVNEGVFGSSGNGSCSLHGHHYMWSNSNSFHPRSPSPMMWPNSPSFVNGVPAHGPPQLHAIPRVPSHMLNTVIPIHHHHVGSAPAVNPPLWDRRHAYAGESPEASSFHPGSLGSMGYSGSSILHPLELASHNIFPRVGGNCMDSSISATNVGLHSPQQRHIFPGRNLMIPMLSSFDSPNERFRSRRNEASSNQADKKQFELDIDRILRGEDTRTTLMLKNIPNKYTSKMLLAAIDEHHRGTYDFIYLPIDFKNKCNVGYAFINMIDPIQIIPFFQAFNGKKWEKFNSEKVASLAYARIQGKAALIAHFQNSSLMNEDKRCRPILFHSDGPNAGDQEPFPMGVNIRSRPGKPRTNVYEENHQGSPSTSANGEASSNGTDLSGSAKDLE